MNDIIITSIIGKNYNDKLVVNLLHLNLANSNFFNLKSNFFPGP